MVYLKIGEFSKASGMPVSVLRYYDSCGLLKPYFVDRFSGYRYYSESQIAVCGRINELKNAEFSLSEMKLLFSSEAPPEKIDRLFNEKKEMLRKILRRLDELYELVKGDEVMNKINNNLLHENVNLKFENDERIIGKWKVLGEFAERADFELGDMLNDGRIGNKNREIYFLPEGEWYWCYSWTKGKLLIDTGDSSYVNEYEFENRADGLYMFVRLKSYAYLKEGKTTLLVLRRIDNLRYNAKDIARRDDIGMSFVPDDRVLGKWRSVANVQNKEDFAPENCLDFDWYFREVEFLPEGECVSYYADEKICGRDKQEWTKGFLLRKWNFSACAYEIKNIGGTDYLFMEWKSGDYRWGGFDTDYYVFKRAK